MVAGTTVLETTDYDPWGVVLAERSLGGGTREGFTSQPRDLTVGWDDFGARQYLAAYGRWGGVDPLAAATPQWSGYAYALNNPVALVDAAGDCSRPPTLRPGLVGICIGQFISTWRVRGVGIGDRRGPVGDDPSATARVFIWLTFDPRTGRFEDAVFSARRSRLGLFQGFLSVGRHGRTSVSISGHTTDGGTTRFTVSTDALNGWGLGLPGRMYGAPTDPINSELEFEISESGAVTVVEYERDAYPSLEVFRYTFGGEAEDVLYIPESGGLKALKPPMEQTGGTRRKPTRAEYEQRDAERSATRRGHGAPGGGA